MARIFTLDEANALLPQLRKLLTELQQAVEELIALEGVAEPSGQVRRNGHHTTNGAWIVSDASRKPSPAWSARSGRSTWS